MQPKQTPMVDRPIFIVAPHRSGTTLLLDLLAHHEDVASFSKVHHRLRVLPRGAAWLDRWLGSRAPHEAQHVWDRFRERDSDDAATAAEVTKAERDYFRTMVGHALASRKATRFVAKYPRLSLRVSWLDAIFPDALFVHLERDWRAVVLSTVKRKRKRGAYSDRWFGVRIPGWRELNSLSSVAQSAEIFRSVTLALEAERRRLGARMLSLRYEDLCTAPRPVLRALCEQLGLKQSPALEEGELPKIRPSFGAWRSALDPAELATLRARDPDFFARYEFEPEPEPALAATNS